ncbi:hypothetical protein ACJJIF_19550 [Microbulbifer sp. SSSA002]|uniref:hypothetical protein n=1 Tax=unclassified Microbulbifer TaxID=2619833 RepID=UPI004039E43E
MNNELKMRPTLEELPLMNAGVADYDCFARSFDPTSLFQELWGDEYAGKARSLWKFINSEFKEGKASSSSIEELLLCINYSCAIAPYLGDYKDSLEFFEWIVLSVKSKL